MKYRSALTIHFKPGKSREAIPLLRKLWPGASISRRVGKETALIGIHKDVESLDIIQENTEIAEKLDPMIIDGSVTQHIGKLKFNEFYNTKVVKIFEITFNDIFAYQEVRDAIKENCETAKQKGFKVTFCEKQFVTYNGPVGLMFIHHDSLDDCADWIGFPPEMRNYHILIRSRTRNLEESVWQQVD